MGRSADRRTAEGTPNSLLPNSRPMGDRDLGRSPIKNTTDNRLFQMR
ncbi:hypothetical protein [Phormidium sp. CCY1219]|nr:hypothetical protein [Phormidium sp. CCY1219]MEB3827514.1 hypothetical protein [Phormidium sp. CCY1219]